MKMKLENVRVAEHEYYYAFGVDNHTPTLSVEAELPVKDPDTGEEKLKFQVVSSAWIVDKWQEINKYIAKLEDRIKDLENVRDNVKYQVDDALNSLYDVTSAARELESYASDIAGAADDAECELRDLSANLND